MYTIEVSKKIGKSISKIPAQDKKDILEKLEELQKDPRPHGYEPLEGVKAKYFRVRVGNYRIVYEIIDKKFLVVVITIAGRKDVYRCLS